MSALAEPLWQEADMSAPEAIDRRNQRTHDATSPRETARNFLNNFRLPTSDLLPPIDAEYLAEKANVDVVYADLEDSYRQEIGSFATLLEGDEIGRIGRIFVNRLMSAEWKNFAIAHELAHVLMHRDYLQSEEYEYLPYSSMHDISSRKEEHQADKFAMELLVPRRILVRYMREANTSKLASIFVVPIEIVERQLKSL